MRDHSQILYHIEVHSAEGIRDYFEEGGNPLPQMHRKPQTVAETISLLIKHAHGIDYVPGNVPCAYLK